MADLDACLGVPGSRADDDLSELFLLYFRLLRVYGSIGVRHVGELGSIDWRWATLNAGHIAAARGHNGFLHGHPGLPESDSHDHC